MGSSKKVLVGAVVWVAGITALHLALNVDWAAALNRFLPEDQRKLNVAYIPVT